VRGHAISDRDPIYIVGEIACGTRAIWTRQAPDRSRRGRESRRRAAGISSTRPPTRSDHFPFTKLSKTLSFTQAQWRELMAFARKHDIAVSAFVYDDVSTEWALDLKPDMLKLNSSDISNPDLIIAAAKSGLPFTVGTGASTFQKLPKPLIGLSARWYADDPATWGANSRRPPTTPTCVGSPC